MSDIPDDVVNGADPEYTLTPVTLPGFVCTCGYTDRAERGEQHLSVAHPARRNSDLTCHAAPVWDDKWCLRPKGHDGKHWTPSFGGGQEW